MIVNLPHKSWTGFQGAGQHRYAIDEHGTLSYFLWDGLNVLQERATDGTVQAEHTNAEVPIEGIGQVVETYRPTAAVGERNIYPVMDVRGTIERWLKDDGETVMASRTYNAFGEIISETGTWPSRYGYQGQAWMEIASADGAQQLILSPTRLFDYTSGRFISRDPADWYIERLIIYGITGIMSRFFKKLSRPVAPVRSESLLHFHSSASSSWSLGVVRTLQSVYSGSTNLYLYLPHDSLVGTDPTGMVESKCERRNYTENTIYRCVLAAVGDDCYYWCADVVASAFEERCRSNCGEFGPWLAKSDTSVENFGMYTIRRLAAVTGSCPFVLRGQGRIRPSGGEV